MSVGQCTTSCTDLAWWQMHRGWLSGWPILHLVNEWQPVRCSLLLMAQLGSFLPDLGLTVLCNGCLFSLAWDEAVSAWNTTLSSV